MPLFTPADSEVLIRPEKKIKVLEQPAGDLARSVETVRQRTARPIMTAQE